MLISSSYATAAAEHGAAVFILSSSEDVDYNYNIKK